MFSNIPTLAFAVGAILGHAQGSPTERSEESHSMEAVSNATAFSIVYGYPLGQYVRSTGNVLSTQGANTIFSEKNTATASEAAIVRPNVDTLYSVSAIDLSHSDLAFTVPEVDDDRFYVIPFYDLWGDNFANLGSLNSTVPGKYLLQLADDSSKVGCESPGHGSEYQGVINFPTTYGLILPRILLFNNTAADLDAVHSIQAGIKIEEVARTGPAVAPRLTSALLNNSTLNSIAAIAPTSLDSTSARNLLQVVARVAPYNMPPSSSDAAVVDENFKLAGLSHGKYVAPRNMNFTLANEYIADEFTVLQSQVEPFNNDWVDFVSSASGDFHNNYVMRSHIAFLAYLELVHYEALYPEYIGTGPDGLSLTADQSYILTFASGRPVVDGFWSLTAYNSSSYLIPNTLDRYALGDRSNLTYPNGDLVYGTTSGNEPFSILIQPADLQPPSNWTSNWLPGPAGGGNFTVNLRFYGPTDVMLAGGSYQYPIVTRQAAITS